MNLVDIALIMLFITFFMMGFKNGVIKETVSFIGMILVFIISYAFKGVVGDFLCLHAPFFNFIGLLEGIHSFNILVYQLIAFLLVFSVLLGLYAIIVGASSIIQRLLNLTIVLILPSKILGGIVGLFKGCLVIFMLLTLFMLPFGDHPFFTESKLTKKILYETPILSKNMKSFTTYTKEVYDVVRRVSDKEITSTEADVQCLRIMLKYKVVSSDTVKELIQNGKLKVSGSSVFAS